MAVESDGKMQSAFYSSYGTYKGYQCPRLSKKDIARFDAEIWIPASFSKNMSCLEIGCGTGEFLTYLSAKGLKTYRGIDHDKALRDVLPTEIKNKFECVDIWEFLKIAGSVSFDRIVLLDVLEHFSPDEGFRLLRMIKNILSKDGKVVIKVPNASSPWGINHQFGDLTHKTAYNGESLRQLAVACELTVDSVYGQRRGTRRRMFTDAVLHKFLSWALLNPPPIWGANLYCIFSLRD